MRDTVIGLGMFFFIWACVFALGVVIAAFVVWDFPTGEFGRFMVRAWLAISCALVIWWGFRRD